MTSSRSRSTAPTGADTTRYECVVPAADAGERLDRFLAGAVDGLSRSRIKSLIEKGQVSIGARTIEDPSYRVKPGERIDIIVPAPVDATPRAQSIPLAIIYEDDDLIVIDKPAGLVVHPAPGNPDRTLVNALIAHCGDSLAGIGGERRPGIVHRLDKDTSGLMVAAKTDAAYAGLGPQFAGHTIERVYRALVWGAPRRPEGVIDAPIGRSPTNRKKMAIVSRGRRAVTHYRVLSRYGGPEPLAALVECRLETGRTHQIRVHMAHLGHPVVGDPLYGRGRRARRKGLDEGAAARVDAFPRQALHAAVLGFAHPRSGRKLRFEAPMPADMAKLVHVFELLQKTA